VQGLSLVSTCVKSTSSTLIVLDQLGLQVNDRGESTDVPSASGCGRDVFEENNKAEHRSSAHGREDPKRVLTTYFDYSDPLQDNHPSTSELNSSITVSPSMVFSMVKPQLSLAIYTLVRCRISDTGLYSRNFRRSSNARRQYAAKTSQVKFCSRWSKHARILNHHSSMRVRFGLIAFRFG
jgi:hypothetical protein